MSEIDEQVEDFSEKKCVFICNIDVMYFLKK